MNAPSKAAGATVKLYKVTKSGKKVYVKSLKANGAGNARFVVRDTNKKTFTKYVAYVTKTAKTFAAWTAQEEHPLTLCGS